MRESALGPYHLDRELGSGGMGTVYAAQVTSADLGLEPGTRVALKVIHPHLVESAQFFERFLREAEIGAAIRHENVVATHGAGTAEVAGTRHHYLVMELVEGQTLRSLLRELERVPEELCRHVGREVAKGLAAIHAAGVLHRDVKPENVLITSDHRVKVMDLGVARLQDEAVRLSQTGAFVGSIHYAAPESLRERGRHVDGRADLHALGLVLYELSTGVNPYFAEDVPQVLMKVLHELPRRLGDANPQLSPFFEEVVHCLLAKNPEERFPDATTLHAALEQGEASAWWSERAKAIRAATHRPLRRIRIPRETAVYGRETEVARLRALYGKAKAGDGQVVLVEGEAGIGKSRLVDELVGRLQREGEDLDFLFGSYPPGGAAMAAEAFGTAFREHLGEADLEAELRARLGPAASLAPAFAALLLGAAPPAGGDPLTRDSLRTCFVATARSLAAERPAVILIDDLHFATDDARALFVSLAMAVPGHRLMLVGTMRPGIDARWLADLTRLPQAGHVTIGRLGPKDLALLLADSFKSERLARQLGHQIAVKSDGNPFFAFEIIRDLREGRLIAQRDDGAWISTGAIEEIRIPSSVLDLVNARVAHLTEDERNLLDAASCWGFEFDGALVGEALGLARIPALRKLGQIERLHRLVRSSGRTHVFDHHQVQEVIHASLNEQLREEYHAALALALEARATAAGRSPESIDGAACVDLCEHFLRGARGERALVYLRAAQAQLEEGYRHEQLASLTERALAVPGLLAGADRARVLLRLESALGAMGRRGRQEECLVEAERLAEEADSASLRGAAAMALGNVLWQTSRYEEAEVALQRALGLARATGDRRSEAGAVSSLGNLFNIQLRPDEARRWHEPQLALAREIGDKDMEARAAVNAGNVYWNEDRYADARELYERGLALARECGRRPIQAIALVNLGPARLRLGDLRGAREALEESLRICRETGSRYPEGFALYGLADVALEEDRLAEAHRLLLDCMDLRREIGDAAGLANSLRLLSVAHVRAGRLDEARGAAEEALTHFRAQGRKGDASECLGLLADLAGGDARAAEQELAEAGADGESPTTRMVLWKATGDRAHLVEAKRQLDAQLAKQPPALHEAMLTNLRVNREIVEACRELGLD